MSEAKPRELHLNFHGRIIDHLGIQMYQSPVAAVAEIVSNAWDAEAQSASIYLPKHLDDTAEIVIRDNGLGMTIDDCQKRFLEVGLDRRKGKVKETTPTLRRTVLGRKGIGKFAGFGIAKIIEIDTVSAATGERTVFALDADKLRSENEYVATDPKTIDVLDYEEPSDARKDSHGTTIRLRGLTIAERPSPVVFGRSMARRFLLHQRVGNFRVTVDDQDLPDAAGTETLQGHFADRLPYLLSPVAECHHIW